MEIFKDINGDEIKEGQTISFSFYAPEENTEVEKVYIHPNYGRLWAGNTPISLLINNGLDYRKVKIIKNK